LEKAESYLEWNLVNIWGGGGRFLGENIEFLAVTYLTKKNHQFDDEI